MHTLPIDDIRAMPEYRELLYKRRKITLPMTVVVLLAYFGFIYLVAYHRDVLATRLSDGITSVGIVLGLTLILITFAITAFNVWYVNQHISGLVDRIQAKAVIK